MKGVMGDESGESMEPMEEVPLKELLRRGYYSHSGLVVNY